MHIQLRPLSARVSKCVSININNQARGRGRPIMRTTMIKKDMNGFGLSDDLALGRMQWRKSSCSRPQVIVAKAELR